jgi:hypothetical protein
MARATFRSGEAIFGVSPTASGEFSDVQVTVDDPGGIDDRVLIGCGKVDE